MKDIVKRLIRQIKMSDKELECIKFFTATNEKKIVWLSILDRHYDQKPISVEELIEQVAPHFASRSTVKNIIEDAVYFGYVKKTQDRVDRRKFILSPTENLIQESTKWSEKFKESFKIIPSILAVLSLAEPFLTLSEI